MKKWSKKSLRNESATKGAFLPECEICLLKSLCYQAVFPPGIVTGIYHFIVCSLRSSEVVGLCIRLLQIYRSYAARWLVCAFVCYKYIAATQRERGKLDLHSTISYAAAKKMKKSNIPIINITVLSVGVTAKKLCSFRYSVPNGT